MVLGHWSLANLMVNVSFKVIVDYLIQLVVPSAVMIEDPPPATLRRERGFPFGPPSES